MTYELQESPSVKTRDHQHTTEFPEKQTRVVRFCLIGRFLHVAWPQTHTNVYFWHPVIFSSDSECHTAYNTKCPCWVLAEYHVISSQTEHFWDHSGQTSHVLRPVATSFVSILHSKNILQKKNPTHKHSSVPKWEQSSMWKKKKKQSKKACSYSLTFTN